ncbi:virulence factor TspB C-terminal domain-related protein [Stutzerimonas kunmingensis]|uniref:virulence factor TspB C-terminal domain-related protein n=1 Tax=Stutzerimonas kunmingensis TaxID=1211807 RepID=UPI0037CF39A8
MQLDVVLASLLMRRVLKGAAVALSILFSCCLYAESYYATRLNGTGKWSGSSPVAASTAACKALWPPSGTWTMIGQPSNPYPEHECRHGSIDGYYVAGHVDVFKQCDDENHTVVGYATECPVPAPNQCEATNGQTVNHEHLMKAAVGQPTIDPPGSVCGGGCQYAFTYTPASNVYVYTSGNPPGVFGVYSYSGNGIECNESTLQTPGNPSEGETQNPDDTPPPEDGDQCPEGYTYNGTFCSPDTPPDPTDPTDPTDPPDPTDPSDPGDGEGDGGSDGGGSGDNGSGDGDGGSSGEGEGENGSGSGDGEGTEQEEEPEPESSVGGEPCEATLSCEGDAVQCAILRQQKELRCHVKEQGDFEKHQSEIETAVQGERFELNEGSGVIDVPSFVNQGTRFLPSTCPTAESFSLTTAGGRTFQLSYEPLCRAASDLSGLFVAVATVLAALYVGRSVGGQ